MKQLLLLMIFLISYTIARPNDYLSGPLYYGIQHTDNIIKATILDRTQIDNSDTCKNGKVVKLPPQFIYKCHLIENIYGNVTDSVLNLTYSDPTIEEYDDSCNVIATFQIIAALGGCEANLNAGDVVFLLFDRFNQIVAARRVLTDLDILVLHHFADLKKMDKSCTGYKIKALGKTKSSKLCILSLSYESSVNDYIPTVFILNNNGTYKYRTYPYRQVIMDKKLENINPNIVWTFRVKEREIVINDKWERYKLPIVN